MKTYNVKQIAELLNTTPETVRRWIRDGKLQATQNSKKEGNVIEEEDLIRFLETVPKYAGVLVTLMSVVPGVGIPFAVASGVAGSALATIQASWKKAKQASVDEGSLATFLKGSIKASKAFISQKEFEIQQAENAIKNERKNISELEKLLSQIESKKGDKE